jgi:hypothetical protein
MTSGSESSRAYATARSGIYVRKVYKVLKVHKSREAASYKLLDISQPQNR